jgi:hypothetical protein
MKIKEEFHQLIDSIENEDNLKAYYQLIHDLNDERNGYAWDKLSAEHQKKILQRYEGSLDQSNLVLHDEVMKKYDKWLE